MMTRTELRENIFKIIFRAAFHDKDDMPEQQKEYDIEFSNDVYQGQGEGNHREAR